LSFIHRHDVNARYTTPGDASKSVQQGIPLDVGTGHLFPARSLEVNQFFMERLAYQGGRVRTLNTPPALSSFIARPSTLESKAMPSLTRSVTSFTMVDLPVPLSSRWETSAQNVIADKFDSISEDDLKYNCKGIPVSRRAKIEAMLVDDPADTFLRYGLAMEFRSEGNHDASIAKLTELTGDETPYVPAYFMAAQQLTDLGRIDEARTFLRDGIDEARRQGDGHAAAEMSELLSSLGELGEDAL